MNKARGSISNHTHNRTEADTNTKELIGGLKNLEGLANGGYNTLYFLKSFKFSTPPKGVSAGKVIFGTFSTSWAAGQPGKNLKEINNVGSEQGPADNGDKAAHETGKKFNQKPAEHGSGNKPVFNIVQGGHNSSDRPHKIRSVRLFHPFISLSPSVYLLELPLGKVRRLSSLPSGAVLSHLLFGNFCLGPKMNNIIKAGDIYRITVGLALHKIINNLIGNISHGLVEE
ncbi:unnamed protein product [marine sediment metagenome]|uniref:Uncharacterized protein n=1 Tax=marine sediment metagenome TaxID=412755 RepID=X1MJR0_9ZZZZ